MLGTREKNLYGPIKLEQIHAQMKDIATKNEFEIEFFQSNLEGEIVDRIQECFGESDGIIINPAAYTHTSIAIRDAISAVNIPTVEVHISNIHNREEFRHKSMIAPVTAGQIIGFGPLGYHLAMISMMEILNGIKLLKNKQQQIQKK
jgi:3-dehydroquinate dehydratase-2